MQRERRTIPYRMISTIKISLSMRSTTWRNRQIQEERPTEPVDELIDKVANAPTRKVKVVPCRAMRNDDKKTGLILSVCGIVPVIWLALMTAPYVGGGLVEIIRGLPVAMGNPCQITVCRDSVKTVLIFFACLRYGYRHLFLYTRELRRREEHGSAKWGDAGALGTRNAVIKTRPQISCSPECPP